MTYDLRQLSSKLNVLKIHIGSLDFISWQWHRPVNAIDFVCGCYVVIKQRKTTICQKKGSYKRFAWNIFNITFVLDRTILFKPFFPQLFSFLLILRIRVTTSKISLKTRPKPENVDFISKYENCTMDPHWG